MLVISSTILILLAIPMVSYTVLRMSSNVKIRESWLARRPVPSWMGPLTGLIVVSVLVCITFNWLGFSDTQWDQASLMAFPYLFLFMAFGDTEITREPQSEEDNEETRRRWAFAYHVGRRAGSFYSTSLRNKRSI
jgi:hypothetical protein